MYISGHFTGHSIKDSSIFSYKYLLDTKIVEVNLFAFAYRLFHRDFSPLNGAFALILILFPALYIFYINLVGFLNG